MSENGKEQDRCLTCGEKSYRGEGSLIPVWEDPSDYQRGEGPDYIGCTECHTMRPVEPESDSDG